MIKVMIVDDEYFVRHGLVTSIPWEENSFNIVGEAENGEEALEKIEILKPDIILTDVKMPVLDGIELIKRLREINDDSKVIFLTCYDDFKYAQQAIHYGAEDYILKLSSRPEEILKVMQKAKLKLESERKHEISAGNIFDINTCDLEKFFIGKKYIKAYWVSVFIKPNLRSQIIFYSQKLARHEIELKDKRLENMGVHTYITTDNHVLYFIEDGIEQVHLFCRALKRIFHEHTGVLFSFGISNMIENITDSKTAVKEAISAYEFCFYNEAGSVMSYSDTNYKTIPFTLNENEIIRAFESLDRNSIRNFMENMLSHIMYSPVPDFKNWCIELLFIMVCCLRRQNKFIPAKYKNFESMLNHFLEYDNYRSFVDEMYNSVEELFVMLETNINEQKAIISKIKLDIDNNYAMQLSLDFFANQVNLSYCYLSSLFKSETGYSFKEYLNYVRVNYAKELLKDVISNIYMVSDKVGYSNPYYFSKVFKKYTGMTPMEYKNRFGLV